jgi:ATP-binding cassette subfamily B protein
MMIMPITHLGRIVEIWQNAFASMNRLDEVFAAQSDIIDLPDASTEEVANGEIEIKNLTFKYGGAMKNSLEDINIHVPAGKTLGIIGTTGSGKTTLMNLLLRLYKIDDGQIFIDGIDINKRETYALRKNIGYVPQDNFLFADTININIKFFDELIKKESVIDSAKLACVYENIMGFPQDFATIIGERGITLSGGQKQRVSIARAVVKNPAILILDDSLSAVDTNTEEQILSNIKQILTDRTGIIISHRISTVKNADEIIYLDKGRIIERGTHGELLAKGGEYYKLNEKQAIENSIYGDKLTARRNKPVGNGDPNVPKIRGFFGGGDGGEM